MGWVAGGRMKRRRPPFIPMCPLKQALRAGREKEAEIFFYRAHHLCPLAIDGQLTPRKKKSALVAGQPGLERRRTA